MPASNNSTDITFAGATRLTPNLTGNRTQRSIIFASGAGAFTLGGSSTLTIASGGIINNSGNLQTINNQITLDANQIWNAANGSITINGYVSGGNKTITLDGSHAITFNHQLNGTSTINVTGSGNRTFNNYVSFTTLNAGGTGTSTYNGEVNGTTVNVTSGTHILNGAISVGALVTSGGATTISGNGNTSLASATVNGGTLTLNRTGGYAINGNLTVNNGGSVIFQQDNQVRSGGTTLTLAAGSYVDLNGTDQTFQNLVVTGDAVIDFGGGSGLTITNYSGITIADGATLTIANWNGAVDHFSIGAGYSPSILPKIIFDGYGNSGWSGGFVTPGPPIPEPASCGLLALGSILAGFLVRRPRRKA